MAQPANTFDTYDAVGIRESLSDIIYNISPMETPFITGIGREKASNVFEEWQTDALDAVDANNAVVDGDDATLDASSPTARVGNRCQISDKTAVVSGTLEAVRKAGRMKELAYQIAKKGKSLRRDMEAIVTGNQASVTGDSTTARKLGSLRAWLKTNTELGGGAAANGGFAAGNVAAATDGDQRAITEALVQAVIRKCWTQGGDPTVIMCGPVNKVKISAFTGGATRFDRSEDLKLFAAIDVYRSDFGTHRIVPNRFSRERDVFVLDMKMWSLKFLRGFRQWPLAKTGDSHKRQILAEYTLCSKQEAASGVIADCTTT